MRGLWSFLKRPAVLALLGMVAIPIVIYVAWVNWPREPEPVRTQVSISSPSATPLREHAVPDTVEITFDSSVARLEQVDKAVEAGITVEPALEGAWQWRGDSRLVFTPAEDWSVDTTYSVTLAQDFVADHVLLEKHELSFSTASFRTDLNSVEFYQDPVDPKVKKVVATARFSHPVDHRALESQLAMEIYDPENRTYSPLNFTVSYDEFDGEAYVHSEIIPIPAEDTHVVVRIKEGVSSQRGGNSTTSEFNKRVTVPGMFNLFRVRGVNLTLVRNERWEPEQVVVLNTTAGVLEAEAAQNLQVWVLPKDKPAREGNKKVKNHRWRDAEEIDESVLSKGRAVTVSPIPAELEYPTQHTFEIEVPPKRYIFVRLQKGTKAYGDYVLAKNAEYVVRVPDYPKEINIMHEGAILSVTGDRKLNLLSRGLPAVQIALARVMPDELNHLLSQTGGDFKNPSFRDYYRFNEQNISEIFKEVRKLDNSDPAKTQYTAVDFSKYLKADGGGRNRGLFFLNVYGWDAKRKRRAGPTDWRFVLVTDLGVVVKKDVEGARRVFVQSIASGEPVAAASVQVIGKNGLPLFTRATGADGSVGFPKLADFKREKDPVAIVVRSGSDLSFIPIGTADRNLNYSRFDTGGVRTKGKSGRLSASMFSDRGIYRPGDTIHVGAIVKPVDWSRSVSGVPIQITVNDARGLEVRRERKRLPASGFIEITHSTEPSSPTGSYHVQAFIVRDGKRGALIGSTRVRVEEFIPDRLKISARFEGDLTKGWVKPDALKARVELRNLFGTPAVGHTIAAQMTLNPTWPGFRGYREYRFSDPSRAKRSYEEVLGEFESDGEGSVEIDFDLTRFEKATYRLSLLANGFELDGGRAVSAERSILVSPNEYLVGVKSDGGLSYIKKAAERSLEIIAVDPDLKKTAVKNLKATLLEKKWVSVLVRQPNGTYKYQSVMKKATVSEKTLNIAAKGARYALPTKNPGTFILSIRNQADVELNQVEFTVVGAANLTRSLERNAELQVRLDKNDYAIGDTIEVHVRAPYTGSGLITIERDRVFTHKWFTADTTSSVHRITVPEGIEANAYVNVAFVRALDSDEVFMSPLSYGVVPFTVSRASRTIDVDIETPELVKPGDELKMTFTASQASDIAIFAIDEGVLQVAKYKTPDPLSFFLSKRALEVTTRQILDLILPEYELVREASQEGGGEEAEALGKNLNPFRRKTDAPVAYWSGIIKAGPEAKSVTYRVPDYFNGTLRVMAVAVSPSAIGTFEDRVLARGPFVIQPNTPLFAGPGDTFVASVSVANNVEGSGDNAKVAVSLKTSEHLEVVGDKKQTIKIAEGRQGSARFDVRAKKELGSADMKFTAALGKKSVSYTATTSVRPPTPFLTTLESGKLGRETKDIEIKREMYPQFRKLEVSVSPLPLGLSGGLLSFLDKFPYGCTEQITSRTVPALVLSKFPGFGYSPKRAKQIVRRTLGILGGRQNADGAFGFWAANSHVNDFQTVYAMQFITEATERGLLQRGSVLSRGLKYLRGLARAPVRSIPAARTRAFALYVLARNGVLQAEHLASLVNYLNKHEEKWVDDITALYVAATYRLMQNESRANDFLREADVEDKIEDDYQSFYDAQSYLSQYLYLIAKHFPERLPKVQGVLIDRLVKRLQANSYNTLSSALTMYALEAFASAADRISDEVLGQITATAVVDEKTSTRLKLPQGLFPKVSFDEKTKKVRLVSKSPIDVYYQVTLSGYDVAPPTGVINESIEVQREYRSPGGGGPIDSASLGDEVEVVLKLRSTSKQSVYNVAFVDLLPGGFDVVLGRGQASGAGRVGSGSFRPQYVDAREDRVLLFGTAESKVKEFVYRIRATARGAFTVPPAYGESMYNRRVKARSTGAKIEVTE